MVRTKTASLRTAADPLWYKDAIIYELHVRAFQDSNADGIGDFQGLTQRLDYLQDLGVTAIWLLPFYPSPLKDDGYDIADYYSINPIYGTLRDFKIFLNEAHRRNLRVITELVVNHTSSQHPWFERSRRAQPGSSWRDFYVWSDTPDRYKDARIIFRDFEHSNWTWDPVANAYYWHRFYSHQPDLNYDNPRVRKEIQRVLDFWLDMGVDGLRLDAVPYLYEREATSCENLPETHQYLKTLRQHVDQKYGDRMLLAEANQWPEDAVSYFGSGKGDECHMAFHFPLMPRIFMSVRMEDRIPIVDILQQTPPIPETSQWALFLRNHDELTLEMVTDEERDYMYRVYATETKARINLGIRRRLAPLLGNDRRRIELLHLLLLSYPGTPVLYYGDEIGMGDNIFLGDRNGVRTPMQWSSDKNAGFSRASPQALFLPIILDPEYHYEALNVEAQQRNANSLWWWMKRVLALRKKYQAFGRGSVEFLNPENRKILAFVRRWENETILVVANLSRFPQPAQLDLSAFAPNVPVEVFGRTEFPAITDKPYSLTLNPHAAFWFSLEVPVTTGSAQVSQDQAPVLLNGSNWEEILHGQQVSSFEPALLNYIASQRWFRGKGRRIKSLTVRDRIPVPATPARILLVVLGVDYVEGDPEDYLLPIGFAVGDEQKQIQEGSRNLVLARLRLAGSEQEGVLYDASAHKTFPQKLIDATLRRRSFWGLEGELRARPAGSFRAGNGEVQISALQPSLLAGERSNTSIVLGDKLVLKLFRCLELGVNPDLEMRRFLGEHGFKSIPALTGSFEYERPNGESLTLGIVTEFLPHVKDGWEFTADALGRYFQRIGAMSPDIKVAAALDADPYVVVEQGPSEEVAKLIGTYFETARLLGQRTAEMHLVLASDPDDPAFAPEPFTPFYQRSLYQSMRNLAVRAMQALRSGVGRLPEADRPLADNVAHHESQILKRLQAVHESRIAAKRIRCHGDLHLGEVLHTGKDFVFVDFEGDPRRPISERRIKRTALRDVASLIRSFDYVAYAALFKQVELGILNQERLSQLEPWAVFWHRWVSGAFLRAYAESSASGDFLPKSKPEFRQLLTAHLLEKAIHEVAYELDHRPAWTRIPLRAILRALEQWSTSS